MHKVSITHSIRQLALVVAGFLLVVIFLESDGLANWANNLNVGPLRTVAVPVTSAVQRWASPLGGAAARQRSLENLARVGWSDDEALLAAVAATPATSPSANGSGTGTAATPPTASPAASNIPTNTYTNASGSNTPLVSSLPRGTELPPLAELTAGKTRVVALAGDSMMAVGLSNTLMRRAAGNNSLHIVKAFKSGTGLARPEVFNWMDQYPAMIGNEKPDVVIVAIGANDGQGFVVNKKVLAFGTPEWINVYQERVASYLAMIRASGARVLWVGLPPMKSSSYNDKIALINRIDYTVVSQSPGTTYWSLTPFVGDDSGNFREYMTLANGTTLHLRQTDGIHLSDEGADLVSAALIRWLSPSLPEPEKPQSHSTTASRAAVPGKTSTKSASKNTSARGNSRRSNRRRS